MAAPAAPVPLTQAEANWELPNGNAFNQDYNPQNQINSSDAAYLGLSWMYPLPTPPTKLSGYSGFFTPYGVGMPVLIVNGTAFATTVFDETIAFNIANGNIIWDVSSPLQMNSTAGENSGPLPLHSHDGNEWFTTATFGSGVSGPTLWFQGQDNSVYALNALTGALELEFKDFTGFNMVAGNSPTSTYHGIGAANIVIDQQRGILVSGHDAEISADNGRGFFAGWNLNTNPPTLKWVSYDVPPQPNSNVPLNPNFDVQMINGMSAAATFFPGKTGTNGYTTAAEEAGGVLMNTNNNLVVDWKSMSQSQLNSSLYNDWGQVDQTQQCLQIDGGGSTGSTGSGWGGAWLLGSGPSDGMVFLPTNNKDPFVGPCNPGPDLWSASILALNTTTGQWIWGLQTTAHDIWDYDCSWYQGLANETINGVNTQVVLKTCKDGYLFEINALTGHLIWAWDPPSGVVNPGATRCSVCYPPDPLNSTWMGADYPTAVTNCHSNPTITCLRGPQPPYLQYPPTSAGFEDEQAFDPATNMIYVASQNYPRYEGYIGLNSSTYFSSTGEGTIPCPACGTINYNNTVWAIHADTGVTAWHYTNQNQGYRGSIEVTGNMVFMTLSSGDIPMINAQTGQLVRDYYIGAPMDQGVTVGASISGQEYIVVSVGTCTHVGITTCPGTTPGDIVALTLQNVPPGQTSTATKTTTVTSISTTTTASVTTVSGAVSTTTVVSTSGTGVGATTLYAISAIAVIFIVISGFLAARGRRRPS